MTERDKIKNLDNKGIRNYFWSLFNEIGVKWKGHINQAERKEKTSMAFAKECQQKTEEPFFQEEDLGAEKN